MLARKNEELAGALDQRYGIDGVGGIIGQCAPMQREGRRWGPNFGVMVRVVTCPDRWTTQASPSWGGDQGPGGPHLAGRRTS